MLGHLLIDDVRPRTPAGHPAKAVVGEQLIASAVILRDGHDRVTGRVAWRPRGQRGWTYAPLFEEGNDRYAGCVVPAEMGHHELCIEAWTDRPATWVAHVEAKVGAGQAIDVEVEEGALLFERLAAAGPKASRARLLEAAARLRESGDPALLDGDVIEEARAIPDPLDVTRSGRFPVWVDRRQARVGAWYELFPRSEGGLQLAIKRLEPIAAMGFDVVYLPPVHPIGTTNRKGRDGTLVAGPDDPGSPWAIGSAAGGHTAVAPELGTIDDFDAFVAAAAGQGLEVALDYALQCSPDHPWVAEHPEWFQHRPDGSIKHAENPPKKYQDIYPIEFWPADDADRAALWEACLEILRFWIGHGVRIFRVDNPHTKPFAFWEWVIDKVHADHPDVVFLAEAFTRPAVMAKLAELGFSQSYTYFTWRTARWEIEQYVLELAHGPAADYMRPAFWPNTPDILSGPLRNGPRAVFELRLVLAALLSPTYGIYSGYELCENEPASPDNEEYRHSEKYELRTRDWAQADSLEPLITLLNGARRAHRSLTELSTVQFHDTGNDALIAWSKTAADGTDAMLCVVTLDPYNVQEATLSLDLPALGLPWDATFTVHDELDGATYAWSGAHPYVRIDPALRVAHVLAVVAS